MTALRCQHTKSAMQHHISVSRAVTMGDGGSPIAAIVQPAAGYPCNRLPDVVEVQQLDDGMPSRPWTANAFSNCDISMMATQKCSEQHAVLQGRELWVRLTVMSGAGTAAVVTAVTDKFTADSRISIPTQQSSQPFFFLAIIALRIHFMNGVSAFVQ